MFKGNPTRRKFIDSFRRLATPLALSAGIMVSGLAGCRSDADVASENLSTAADNFEIERRIVFYNGITADYILSIQGRCSITVDTAKNKLDVTCKTGPDKYKKHFLGLSNNVTYFAEQISDANVSAYNYAVVFKPQTIIPDILIKGDAEDVKRSVTPRPGVVQSVTPN